MPNRSYSGPVKPRLATFSEVPFTTDAAEYDVLRSPNASTRLDVGYLPQQNAPPKPAGAAVGPNPVPGYTLVPWQDWRINYFVVNYQSTTGNGPIIRQLYFRQALEDLMDQAAAVQGPLRGYGTETVGPVGNTPVTSWLSPRGKTANAFPYDPAQAKSLLAAGDLAAGRRLPAHRGRRPPQGRHPAEPHAQHHPGELVLRGVTPACGGLQGPFLRAST